MGGRGYLDQLMIELQKRILEVLHEYDMAPQTINLIFDQTFGDSPPYHVLNIEFRPVAGPEGEL